MIDRLTPKIESLVRRYGEITEQMARPEVATDYAKMQALAKERAQLDRIVGLYRDYKKTLAGITDAKAILAGGDKEMAALAKEELEALERRREPLAREIEIALLPTDPNDEKSVIVEIRAGAGGDEAGLFASNLYRMYSRYAARRGWQVDVLDYHETGIGGFKEITFSITGKGAYSRLKHESGVHRVQRVPETESGGRIHTSTATVAVLPEAGEVEVNINPDDLRIDIFHAGGHGGQNVQKVATAVRIVHTPTGTTAVCQDERSQLKNKLKAMAVLRARLLDAETRKQEEQIRQTRRSQVGTAERSEKIRTYNFPQNRLTDHRLDLSLHSLDRVMEGKEGELDELIDALVAHEQAQRLQEAVA